MYLFFNSLAKFVIFCVLATVYCHKLATSAWVGDDELAIFPNQAECPPGEVPGVGKTPDCQPTCENREPCNKMFYAGVDTVPCFCEPPLVRNMLNNKCIKFEECPK